MSVKINGANRSIFGKCVGAVKRIFVSNNAASSQNVKLENGAINDAEHAAFLKAGEAQIKRGISVVNGNIYVCKNISPDNIIHECFRIESELYAPEQIQEALKNLDALIGKIKERIDTKCTPSSSIPDMLLIAYGVLKREGYKYTRDKNKEILAYFKNNARNVAYGGVPPEKRRSDWLRTFDLTFTGNMLIKSLQCMSSSLIMLAFSDEMAKIQSSWDRVGIVSLATHMFVKYGADVNIDQGLISSDEYYITTYGLPGMEYLEPLERSRIASIFYFNRASANEALYSHGAAIRDYGRAIELNPKSESAYLNRGQIKQHNDVSGAIADFDKAIESNPNSATAYACRGNVRYCLNDYRQAVNDLDRALELNSKDPIGFYIRGTAKISLRDYLGAQSDLENARKLGIKLTNNMGMGIMQIDDTIKRLKQYNSKQANN